MLHLGLDLSWVHILGYCERAEEKIRKGREEIKVRMNARNIKKRERGSVEGRLPRERTTLTGVRATLIILALFLLGPLDGEHSIV